MNPKKKKAKEKRRARKLAAQAWEEADRGNDDLALKIIRRAVDQHPGNPRLWNDQGLLSLRLGNDAETERCFQAAISLAPTFAEPYAELAKIYLRQGRCEEAAELLAQAVELEPESTTYAALRSACAPPVDATRRHTEVSASESSPADSAVDEHQLRAAFPELVRRIDELAWEEAQAALTQRGFWHVPQLIAPEQCAALRDDFADDALFADTVVMNKPRFGRGTYRYFRAPIPKLVAAVRCLTYPPLAAIANHWQRLLGAEQIFPAAWEEYRAQCAQAGQTTPSPLLLKYEAGGFNALHRDVRGEMFFPIQMVIVLSEQQDEPDDSAGGFSGGEFLFCHQPERKKSDRKQIPASLGDAVFFCTRWRVVCVGGAYGLQSVKHGLAKVTAGTRYALGVPFHEFR